MRLRIGCDIDGVIADYGKASYQRLAALDVDGLRVPFRPDMQTEWNWQKHHFTPAQLEEFSTISAQPEFWLRQIGPLATYDERMAICELTRRHNVYFITHRPMGTEHATREWLTSMLTPRHQGQIVYCGKDDKGVLAQGMKLHSFVDDLPTNLYNIEQATGGRTKTFLYDQPWNRVRPGFPPYPDNGIRVYSITEALEQLQKVDPSTWL
jgi:uncharacterized HAD superfamily protein